MADETAPVATVTGLYRGTFTGLEPLTKETPLTLEEVRNKAGLLRAGVPPGAREGEPDHRCDLRQHVAAPAPGPDAGDGHPGGRPLLAGLVRYPALPGDARHGRAEGLPPLAGGPHGPDPDRKKEAGNARDFSPANGGSTSPVFEFSIAPAGAMRREDHQVFDFMIAADVK